MAKPNDTDKGLLENAIYRNRFSDLELAAQRALWGPICRFLQQYVDAAGSTLDLGAGYCHFINNIRSARKYALDVNRETLDKYAAADVQKLVCSGSRIPLLSEESIDTVFASNVYEHFPSREDVAASIAEVRRILRPGGRFVILQPNFSYCMKEYYDFFDHRLAFTHRAMVEAVEIAGFKVQRVDARFLPYTSKSGLPRAPWLVSLYLQVPPVWKILGGQFLLVAQK